MHALLGILCPHGGVVEERERVEHLKMYLKIQVFWERGRIVKTEKKHFLEGTMSF